MYAWNCVCLYVNKYMAAWEIDLLLFIILDSLTCACTCRLVHEKFFSFCSVFFLAAMEGSWRIVIILYFTAMTRNMHREARQVQREI